MAISKHIAFALLACSLHAHATNYGGNSGAGHGARSGATAGSGIGGGQSSAGIGNGQSGNGGQYQWVNPGASLFDRYQPWPQAEMKQFQNPRGDQS
jgi:hypothetical protein